MEYAPEEYTKHYIVTALFKLMNEYDYTKISVSDIAQKAGVGRATFYRHFKNKEDIIEFYFIHNTKEFVFEQKYYPRCKDDYIKIVRCVFEKFKTNMDCFKLIKKAHLEYLYLNFLNSNLVSTFQQEYISNNIYAPYLYAGMVFNVSMAWLENDCSDSIDELAKMIVNAIYLEQ